MGKDIEKKEKKAKKKKDNDFSTRLMAFTFFYSVAIYLLLIGFHFWDKHIDYKSKED